MTIEPIIESGMTFGPYQAGDCFYVEKSKTYQKIQSGVKMAEFLLLWPQDKPTVLIIEAKSSTPRIESQPDFDNFIRDIREKLSNALMLGVATCLKRHSTWEELPNAFQSLDLSTASFRLILVIKGHQEAWLPPLQDAIKKELHPMIKIWNLPPTAVVIMNDTIAKSQGLIQ